MTSGEEALFPAGASMVFPGNSSDGHYVRFDLLAGALLFLGVISAMLHTKVRFQCLPRSLLQTDVLEGLSVKDIVVIVRGQSVDSDHFSIDGVFVGATLGCGCFIEFSFFFACADHALVSGCAHTAGGILS